MLIAIVFVAIIHILGFTIAYLRKTDKLTDVIYAFSFLAIAGFGLSRSGSAGLFHWILFGMVSAWALRLGIYLGYRIKVWGKDRRFDDYRKNWIKLARFWFLQFLSILIISLPVMFAMQDSHAQPGFWQGFGFVIFLSGFLIESVADYQKFNFKQIRDNQGEFIQSGLWKYSRHPNYFGEWLVWTGIFLYCATTFEGTQWIALVSPVWVFILLRFISGGNLLEQSAQSKYSGRADYQAYVKRTGVFFPKF